MTGFVDFYKLLKVDPLISLEDLKKEMFKQKKLKSSHAASAPTPERRRAAEDFLKTLDEARKVFENESTRRVYDEGLISYKKTPAPDLEGKNNKKKADLKNSDLGNTEASTLLEKAKSAVSARKYESAIDDLKKIISMMPDAVEPRGLLIRTYCDVGTQSAIDSAVKELSTLERLLSNDREAFYAYSNKVYTKMGQVLLENSSKRAM